MNKGAKATIAIVIALAALSRFAFLQMRPPTPDEAINGVVATGISLKSGYDYQPTLGHGPVHFYLLAMSQALLGHNLWSLRVPAVLFGIGTVALMFAFTRFLSKPAASVAAVVVAISPGFVFVSREAIHESEFAFFTLASFFGVLALMSKPTTKMVIFTSSSVVGCLLTKETAVIHLVALLLTMPILLHGNGKGIWSAKQRWSCDTGGDHEMARFGTHWRGNPKRVAIAAFVACMCSTVVIWFFVTGHGTNRNGFMHWIHGFVVWKYIGTQSGEHVKPWYYWFQLMRADELPLLIGMLAAPVFLFSTNVYERSAAAYSLLVFAAYSVIPYKTPWCIISLGVCVPLVFGCLCACIGRMRPLVATCVIVVVLVCSIARMTQLNYWDQSDPREHQVYSATSPDISKLVSIMQKQYHQDSGALEVRGLVFHSKPYPLPWLFSKYQHVDYYESIQRDMDMDSGFVFVEAGNVAQFERSIRVTNYYRIPVQLHLGELPSVLYLNKGVFHGGSNGVLPES